MGEFSTFADTADQTCDAVRTAIAALTGLLQDILCQMAFQISLQFGRAIEIQQCTALLIPNREQTKSLGDQLPVQPPDICQK